MREFSENILESLNDGLVVVDRDDRVVRWNRRLEELYGVRHEAGRRPPARRDLRAGLPRDRCASARRESPDGAALYRVPLATRHEPPRRLLVNVATTPLRDSDGAIAGTIVDRRGHLGARAARGAAADLREDGVDRPARGRRRARGEHAADRHLELHADAARRAPSRTIRRRKVLEKIERQTFRAAKIVNGLLNLARPAQVDSGPVDLNAVINDVLVAARAPVAHRPHPGAQGAARAGRRSCRASSTSCSRCS